MHEGFSDLWSFQAEMTINLSANFVFLEFLKHLGLCPGFQNNNNNNRVGRDRCQFTDPEGQGDAKTCF